MLFHITDRASWDAALAAGTYAPESLRTEGFIHFSAAGQIHETIRDLFAGKVGLVMLSVDEDRLQADVRWEEVEEGKIFPHLYGELNLDAVTQAQELTVATWER